MILRTLLKCLVLTALTGVTLAGDDDLLGLLIRKGILTTSEAEALRAEAVRLTHRDESGVYPAPAGFQTRVSREQRARADGLGEHQQVPRLGSGQRARIQQLVRVARLESGGGCPGSPCPRVDCIARLVSPPPRAAEPPGSGDFRTGMQTAPAPHRHRRRARTGRPAAQGGSDTRNQRPARHRRRCNSQAGRWHS